MRLEFSDFLPDVICPHCQIGLNVDSTCEESREDCEGVINCPECGGLLNIVSCVSFEALKQVPLKKGD